MSKELARKVYDRRVMERYVEKGVMKPADFQAYLKGLNDETNNAQWVQLDLHDAEISDASLAADIGPDTEGPEEAP